MDFRINVFLVLLVEVLLLILLIDWSLPLSKIMELWKTLPFPHLCTHCPCWASWIIWECFFLQFYYKWFHPTEVSVSMCGRSSVFWKRETGRYWIITRCSCVSDFRHWSSSELSMIYLCVYHMLENETLRNEFFFFMAYIFISTFPHCPLNPFSAQ